MRNHKQATIFAALICAILLFGYLPAALAASTTPYFAYLPMVIKQGPSTPAPTNTPVPTQTLTPAPTATSIPPGVQILQNHSYHVDSIDYLHVVGEVLNNTGNHLRFVKITANFFNGGGQLLGTKFTYIHLSNLPAWDKTCFDLGLPEPSGWSYYQFESPTYWTDGQPLLNLAVLNDSGSYKPTYGWYKIIGQVRNDHGVRVEYVSPVSTLYNASGTVVDCKFTYVNSTHLDPGQMSAFEMTFSRRNYSDVALYRLQVDGNP
ncbi:hypothetical protein D4S03_08525 [bacterium]|nr:MAG: hypothetical protein D4S03_08525 [bacterium]